MCGFKWVLTNHGIAEWAVGWERQGEAFDWGALQWSAFSYMTQAGLYLLCFCLSVVSLSLQSAAPSGPDPGWRQKRNKLSIRLCQLLTYCNIKTWWTNKLNHVSSSPCPTLLVTWITYQTTANATNWLESPHKNQNNKIEHSKSVFYIKKYIYIVNKCWSSSDWLLCSFVHSLT